MLKKLREVKSCLTQHNDRVVGFENGDMSTFLISHFVIFSSASLRNYLDINNDMKNL